ncbi:hypothetical protein ACFPN0_01275 [Kitasatospora cinereorecta]
MIRLADPLRFLTMLAAWVATSWALAPRSVVSVVLLLCVLTVFVTPGDNGTDREKILVPVPGVVTIALMLLHHLAAVISSWAAWPTWAAGTVTILAATSLITERPRWRDLLAVRSEHGSSKTVTSDSQKTTMRCADCVRVLPEEAAEQLSQ